MTHKHEDTDLVVATGVGRLSGSPSLPGDKSISHRLALLASVAEGTSLINGFAQSADCSSTLECVSRLGITVERSGDRVAVHGRGLRGYHPAEAPVRLDAGNSGSTIRMLSGLLAGQKTRSIIDGDESLRRRPMSRIMEPLRLMGAGLTARDGAFPPLTIDGNNLNAIEYTSPIASAQVKTCVLFAGLLAAGVTTFKEPGVSRTHSELMLREFHARISFDPDRLADGISIEGNHELTPVTYDVPGDPSSAAFFAAAAAALPGSTLVMKSVGLNPSRIAFLEILKRLGARVEIADARITGGEPVGDLVVAAQPLCCGDTPLVLSGSVIPNLIDEIPVLAVVASQAEGRFEVRDARELRIKESDRIRTVVEGLRALGIDVEEYEDGFGLVGPQTISGGTVQSRGDHRIAMAFTVAGLLGKRPTKIVGASCARVSFPGFYRALESVLDEGSLEGVE
ncbi:MAG TPA: 3-phosphoshikimate 1-carboxyvinyltransferase [Blastocatellia bacterium]|nr:3-phosphoshikimate 1-carboxyvinyltransferase [Blastocatellia bacterium]